MIDQKRKKDHENEFLALNHQDRTFAIHKQKIVKQILLNWLNN